MSLRQIFNDELHNLVTDYTDDLSETVSYTRVDYYTDYDFSTGATNKNESTVNVTALFGSFSKEQLAMNDIMPEDVKATISVKSINFTPQNNDTITRNDRTYQVIRVENKAFNSLWVLQLRETE